LPKKPGVSLQIITPLPKLSSQKFFKKSIFFVSFIVSLTISNKPIYLTGLKKWVMQKSFLSSLDIFSDKAFSNSKFERND